MEERPVKTQAMVTRMAMTMLVLVSMIASGAAQSKVLAADADKAALLEANDAFYAALNAMFQGNPRPFEELWWHTDDLVYMGADGAYNVGWEQAYANWKAQAALKLGGEVKAVDVRVTIAGDMAMINQYTVGTNHFRDDDREIKLRATSVFHKKNSKWKMICHHVDVIPPLEAAMADGP
jgi:SnoaL-like domain